MARQWMLLCAAVLLLSGCVKFAVVYVNAKDTDSQSSVSVDVFSAKDGLYLGETPLNLDFEKLSTMPNPTLSLLIIGECYPAHWQLIEISNWAPSRQQARDAAFKNEVLFKIRTETGCTKKK